MKPLSCEIFMSLENAMPGNGGNMSIIYGSRDAGSLPITAPISVPKITWSIGENSKLQILEDS